MGDFKVTKYLKAFQHTVNRPRKLLLKCNLRISLWNVNRLIWGFLMKFFDWTAQSSVASFSNQKSHSPLKNPSLALERKPENCVDSIIAQRRVSSLASESNRLRIDQRWSWWSETAFSHSSFEPNTITKISIQRETASFARILRCLLVLQFSRRQKDFCRILQRWSLFPLLENCKLFKFHSSQSDFQNGLLEAFVEER